LGVGLGVELGLGEEVGLAVGEGMTVGADPPPLGSGRTARTVTARATTTPIARTDGAAELRVVDRAVFRVVMRESSVAIRPATMDVRPKHHYDN